MVNTKVKWTNSALKNARKIHSFYKKTANKQVADKILNQVFITVQQLEMQEAIGQKEASLEKLKLGHRYLFSGHNKIIYTQHEGTIYITHVFDTRQNPKKLK